MLLRGGNTIGLALSWLAVVKAGMVAVATMPLLRARELGDIIDKAQPAAALCDIHLLEELELARKERPVLATVIAFNAPNEPGSGKSVCRVWRCCISKTYMAGVGPAMW